MANVALREASQPPEPQGGARVSAAAATSLYAALAPLGLKSFKALVDKAPRIKAVLKSSHVDVTLFAPTNVALDRFYGAAAIKYKTTKVGGWVVDGWAGG